MRLTQTDSFFSSASQVWACECLCSLPITIRVLYQYQVCALMVVHLCFVRLCAQISWSARQMHTIVMLTLHVLIRLGHLPVRATWDTRIQAEGQAWPVQVGSHSHTFQHHTCSQNSINLSQTIVSKQHFRLYKTNVIEMCTLGTCVPAIVI